MKFVALLSSGIDSPVATYLLSQKNEDVILIHADNRPYTDDREIKNFKKLAKHVKKKISGTVEVFIIPHGPSLQAYTENCKKRFTCVFCKRMLLRYAEAIVEKEGACAIIMGDSLGQVASQTLQNIRVIQQAIKTPVLTPLIGFDKEEIVHIAKDIGTYNLSIQSSDGCSAVPYKPATMARIEDVLVEEEKIDVKKLVKHAINNMQKIEI